MSTKGKTEGIFISSAPPVYTRPTSIAEAIATVSPDATAKRIVANLERIRTGSALILRKNGIADPFGFRGNLNAQSRCAVDAIKHARAALGYFNEGNFVAALDWALIAAEDFHSSRAMREQAVAEAVRKRRAETIARTRQVEVADKLFRERFRRWPVMGRVNDFKEFNEILALNGAEIFKNNESFKSWKSTHKIVFIWRKG